MAFTAVSGLTPVYNSYPNYYLKFYQAGTTTPLAMATDSVGDTTLAKALISSNGFPVTAGNVIFTPHINANYDAYLFPTETEADNNTTVNAIRIADDLSPPTLEVSPNVVGTLADNYTLQSSDNNVIYRCLNTSPITITIPQSLPPGNVTYFTQETANKITFAGATGVTINTPLGTSPYTIHSVVCTLILDSTTTVLTGDLG